MYSTFEKSITVIYAASKNRAIDIIETMYFKYLPPKISETSIISWLSNGFNNFRNIHR